MDRYAQNLIGQWENLLETAEESVGFIDHNWRALEAALFTLHHWDPDLLLTGPLRINMMKNKIQEWARRGGEVPVDQIGWTPMLDAVGQLDLRPFPCDRDWSADPIDLQHAGAVPVSWNHLDAVERIGNVVGWVIEPADILVNLANLYTFHIKDFAASNNNELELVADDIIGAIVSRPGGWVPETVFCWPTYFGKMGVYGYNLWIEKTLFYEHMVAKIILDGMDV